MTYGADMRLLVNQGNIPTVLFGPGNVRHAHRPHEFVRIDELLTAGRTSYAPTFAPRRRAVAIACSPATPAPTMKTRAEATVPAAVMSMGNMRGEVLAARGTPL